MLLSWLLSCGFTWPGSRKHRFADDHSGCSLSAAEHNLRCGGMAAPSLSGACSAQCGTIAGCARVFKLASHLPEMVLHGVVPVVAAWGQQNLR